MLIQAIQKRQSVRTYTGQPLNDEHIALIKQYMSQLQAPFGVKAKIELIRNNSVEKRIKLGTYGWIKGANEYLALIYQTAPFAETAAAYLFEEVVLYCTSIGLGTCWLGGSFSRSDFKKQLILAPNEKLRIVSPVGYAYTGDKKRFLEKYIVQSEKNRMRKPFETLFFNLNFDNPLTATAAGEYFQPLEMVRLAPSANNKQEWRILFEEKALHFYKKPYPMFDAIDMGIALCHFELSCKELGLKGHYELLEEAPVNDALKYVISWKKD